MKIMNKEQFAKTPNGTVFCTFVPSMLSEVISIKTGYMEYDGKPTFNGVIDLCPYFETDEYGDGYDGTPSDKISYYTQCFSTDTGLCDFDDDTLFAVFSKAEIRRMIDVLTYALSDCEGECITDSEKR